MTDEPKTWTQSHHFARSHFCPEHGFPLMAWHRVGKLVCPVRWCPYVELQEDEIATFKAEIVVPDDTCPDYGTPKMDPVTCCCAVHVSYRRVIELMDRRRWDLLPPKETKERERYECKCSFTSFEVDEGHWHDLATVNAGLVCPKCKTAVIAFLQVDPCACDVSIPRAAYVDGWRDIRCPEHGLGEDAEVRQGIDGIFPTVVRLT